jgi:hypothetical protein
MFDLNEGIIWIVKEELEVLEEFILVRRHDVLQEGVAIHVQALAAILIQR